MSRVTNVILTFSTCEDEEQILADVDEFPGFSWRAVALPRRMANSEEGEAVSDVFVAAFNHLDIAAFKDHLSGLPWEEASAVRLLLCEEEEDFYRVFEMEFDHRLLPPGQTTRAGGQWVYQPTGEWRQLT